MRQMSHIRCDSCRGATRCRLAKRTIQHLTRREREIVQAIFALKNRASAEEIRARLTDPPGDSSVRVMLTRLESKGLVRHETDGVRFVYSATTSPAAAKRTALQQVVQTFFRGSFAHMVASLVREGSWSDDELESLRSEVERVRKERKRP
jgi:BlaI family transcriptional regulator, penicillinase repressor